MSDLLILGEDSNSERYLVTSQLNEPYLDKVEADTLYICCNTAPKIWVRDGDDKRDTATHMTQRAVTDMVWHLVKAYQQYRSGNSVECITASEVLDAGEMDWRNSCSVFDPLTGTIDLNAASVHRYQGDQRKVENIEDLIPNGKSLEISVSGGGEVFEPISSEQPFLMLKSSRARQANDADTDAGYS